MSVFRIKNRFLDRFDPFWICRVLALKAGVATTLLFIGNTFLKSTAVPLDYMLTTLIAVIASEVLPADSRGKKLAIFWAVLILLSTGGIFFGLLSYFNIALFVFVTVFSYLVLRYMVKSPASATLPILIVIWGFLQLEGGAATNFTSVANNLLYYYQFGLLGMLTVLFFPDYTPHIFKSAFIRVLESNASNLGNTHYKNSDPALLTALFMVRSKLPLLPDSYRALYESLVQFQAEFMRDHKLSATEQERARRLLTDLASAVSSNESFPSISGQEQHISPANSQAFRTLDALIENYDRCLA